MKIKSLVYECLRQIPKGRVVTYGQIAAYLGDGKMARAVGNILHDNPDGVRYPCYRVVNNKGKLSNNYAFGGIERQKQLLEKDGIVVNDYTVDLRQYQFELK